jgi:hypothetical protein
VKKYAFSALLAMALACVAHAEGQQGSRHPVPDGGSTAALLGASVILLGLAQRKIARAEKIVDPLLLER